MVEKIPLRIDKKRKISNFFNFFHIFFTKTLAFLHEIQ